MDGLSVLLRWCLSITPILHTSRPTLRPLTLEDAPELQKALDDPEIADFTLTIPHPLPPNFALERIELDLEQERSAKPRYGWGLFLRESGRLVGRLGLSWDPTHKRGGLVYWTARDWRGQGLMTEALLEVVRYAFGPLGLYRLEASHFPRNPGSGRVLEKAGFVREGLLRAFVWKDQTPEDMVQYAIIRPDWERVHAPSRFTSRATCIISPYESPHPCHPESV